jgi:hypothetical protein
MEWIKSRFYLCKHFAVRRKYGVTNIENPSSQQADCEKQLTKEESF